MENKRLEIYVGWTCNQKCTYCKEFPTMEKAWDKRVSKYDILKKLIKYKQLGYNHVTYLGGEPFIQPVFYDALLLGKKLGYTILVTTNATTLHIEKQANKFLPYIDELFLSVEALSKESQQKISRTKNYVQWEGVFENITKYWKGTMLKANIVITQDNLMQLQEIVEYLGKKGLKEIAITYPDLDIRYYGKEHTLKKIAPRYTQCIEQIMKIVPLCETNNIHLKLPDFPFCVFPEENREKYIKMTDDYDYQTRLKVSYDEQEYDRTTFSYFEIPRARYACIKCQKCRYKNMCWGPSVMYKELYQLGEINPIQE